MAVVAGAEELFVAVCTAGPALDERIREYRERGRYLQMLLLDELGSWAVDQLRQQLYERVQVELAERGWRTSSPLSPGESDWPMREQRIIFKLLDTAEIGVTLGPNFMMSPQKVPLRRLRRRRPGDGLGRADELRLLLDPGSVPLHEDARQRKTYPCRFRRPRTRGQPDQGLPAKKNEYDPDGQPLRDVNAGTDVRQSWSTPPDKEKKRRWNLISSAPWPT